MLGWSYYRAITVDAANVDATLTKFPLLVEFAADTDLAKARTDGHDIRFTLDDGATALKYERIAWSGGGGSAVTAKFWVRVPSIHSVSGATIRVYYGNPAAGDGEDSPISLGLAELRHDPSLSKDEERRIYHGRSPLPALLG